MSVPEQSLSGIGISETEGGRFSKVDELGCAYWCNNVVIKLDVDLELEEEVVCFRLDLRI